MCDRGIISWLEKKPKPHDPYISASWQLVVTMVTELATMAIITSADYTDDDKDEDKNRKNGDSHHIVLIRFP